MHVIDYQLPPLYVFPMKFLEHDDENCDEMALYLRKNNCMVCDMRHNVKIYMHKKLIRSRLQQKGPFTTIFYFLELSSQENANS